MFLWTWGSGIGEGGDGGVLSQASTVIDKMGKLRPKEGMGYPPLGSYAP